MKISFPDKSNIEIKRGSGPQTILISIQAQDQDNPLKKIINSVELTEEQFKQLVSDVQ